MTKRKFQVGNRVRVVNGWARSTYALVQDGDVGTVTGYAGCDCDVDLDNDPEGAKRPWSIPQRGLELIP